jgi:60 kDa SS-A/Ro ribonucleoprotein
MAKNYQFFTNKSQKTGTSQMQPIPGREKEMIQGRSGSFAFDAGIWSMLRRCLLIGTAQSTYYAGKQELTDDFIQVVQKAIATNPERVAQEILYASDGRAINNSAPILALVFLSMGKTPAAKKAFKEIFPQVVRTGSHFYEWLSYTKSLRGFGKNAILIKLIKRSPKVILPMKWQHQWEKWIKRHGNYYSTKCLLGLCCVI